MAKTDFCMKLNPFPDEYRCCRFLVVVKYLHLQSVCCNILYFFNIK